MIAVVIAVIVVLFVCAVVSAHLAESKGLSGGLYFFLGLLFGVIGLIIAAGARPASDQAAGAAGLPPGPGWYDDPWRQGALRWYDGNDWTQQSRPGDRTS